jgi:hypothetical protein
LGKSHAAQALYVKSSQELSFVAVYGGKVVETAEENWTEKGCQRKNGVILLELQTG